MDDKSVLSLFEGDYSHLQLEPSVFCECREFFINTQSSSWTERGTLFFQSYQFLKYFLAHPTLDGPTQLACFDTTSVWLRRVFNACKQNDIFKQNVWESVERSFWSTLFNLPSTRASIPGVTGVQLAVRDLFTKTLQLYLLTCPNEELKENTLLLLLQQSLCWDRHAKVVCTAIQILVKYTGAEAVFSFQPDFISRSMKYLKDYSYAQAISTTVFTVLSLYYQTLCEKYDDKEIAEDEWMNLWCPVILTEFYGDNRQTQSGMSSFLIPSLLSVSPNITPKFLSALQRYPDVSKDAKDAACLFALKIAKDGKLIQHLDLNNEHSFLRSLMLHKDSKIQLACFNLIALCPNISTPLTVEEFDCIESRIQFAFGIADSDTRQILLKSMHDFFVRIRASCHALQRNIRYKRSPSIPDDAKIIKRSQRFLEYFISACIEYLHPTCNYQQVLCSLGLLKALVTLGLDGSVEESMMKERQHSFPFQIKILNKDVTRILIDRLIDPYDTIRDLSLNILLSYNYLPGYNTSEELCFLFNHGLRLLNSVRVHECEGGAKTICLCNHFMEKLQSGSTYKNVRRILDLLQKNVEVARKSLLQAAISYPIQGYLIQLSYTFSTSSTLSFLKKNDNEWKSLIIEILQLSESVWLLVKEILCDDSPEGNLPKDQDDSGVSDNLEDTPAQLILSYSWRSIKEISSLLSMILIKCSSFYPDVFDYSNLDHYGFLMMSWLWEIRHRGAFTSVYPCFVSYCSFLFAMKDVNLCRMPIPWLQKNIEVVQEKSSFITRRSGGIPFSITGILVAGKEKNKVLLSKTILALIDMSKEKIVADPNAAKVDLPQVHAMNSLKTIFTEHRLSSVSLEYLEPAIALAIEGFSHELWPIRNCSVMLFTALMNRSFGNKRPKGVVNLGNTKGLSTKTFFSKFPSLRPYLLKELQHSVNTLRSNNQASTGLYPILNLFSRLQYAYTYPNEEEWEGVNEFEPLLLQCTASKICKVREIAALSLTCLIDGSHLMEFVVTQLKNVEVLTQNELHGRLLTVRAMLAGLLSNLTGESKNIFFDKVSLTLLSCFSEITSNKRSFYIKKLFLEIIQSYFMSHTDRDAKRLQQLRRMTMDYCKRILFEKKSWPLYGHNFIGLPIHQQTAAEIFLQNSKEFSIHSDTHSIGFLVSKLLRYEFYEVQIATLEHILDHPRKRVIVNNPEIMRALVDLSLKHQWSQLRAPALALLSDLLEAKNYKSMMLDCAEIIEVVQTNESLPVRESLLILLGSYLKHLFMEGNTEVVNYYYCWVDILLKFTNEYMAFSTRKAALSSLIHFGVSFPSNSEEINFTGICILPLILGDVLNDDDEELRQDAAAYACEVLQVSDLCINEVWSLWKQATKKAFGGLSEFQARVSKRIMVHNGLEKASEQLESILTRDSALFETERQNLYYSDYQRLQDLLYYALPSSEELQSWVEDGIKSIKQFFVNVQVDGALGRTSDPNVWYVVFRIIRVAKHVNVSLDDVHELMRAIDAHPDFCY
ncbi:tRNA (cytosine 32-2'-O)-methyltransferase regulator Trm732 [Schizosaccharomyces osmophilus]|uniref:tRNA (Cytosine 32-2'-O)-methyltransferase regulator Trm732 n=1 Tax=Schizosaccharomyces osmophilus TaxID=2545709 RepID=A0AAE9WEN0_9SCHI|nr:tRNA (cytosine 32-2'-O)-methyltransferase regulator Trm732 [Schizosaccharomyces osmophilus]WBW74996.1 tRNA (cytosine 32-2'-O)-methyltransferase regulator Trm732 [Schizosaccharomyces osmophilus]